ncbi:unnamed protein product, partial [Hapterophycus canaliculatus]
MSSLRSAITLALEKLEGVPFPPEWIDQQTMRERGWPGLREALISAHNPQEQVRGQTSTSARA